MKKILTSLIFALPLFAKPIISVSIPPQSYFVQKIAGDSVEINEVIPPNTDEHNFDFKPSTMQKLEQSDIYFTIGLEFEKPMIYKFKDSFKNLKIIDTRNDIKPLYTTFEHSHHQEGEHETHFEHKHAPAVFKDSEVKDRSINDYQGEFYSVYPLLLDDSLDEVFYLKALNNKQSKDEIKAYYKEGYKSDIDKIIIAQNTITFYKKNEVLKGTYAYKGFVIFTYESGKKGVRYQFENTDTTSKAPKFVQFSDHQINPTKSNHFHIFMGDLSFEALNKEMHNWPTFYSSLLSKEQIIEDQIAHIELGNDPHIWLDPLLVKTQARTIAQALSKEYPHNKALYEKNLAHFEKELDALDSKIKSLLKDKKGKKFIVYHPSWAYFAARYDLVQVPVEIEGKEPKLKDLKALIELAKKEKIQTIFVQKGFPQNAARLLAKECGADIAEIDHLARDWENELLNSAQKLGGIK
ncbi:hypothetical protein DMB95_05695 [Campylobacter sp. MIT 12-8780]|uniref:metal ABC transporter solute-binding protein, Zn/Mn family n=1 Tax=unclassified Campylobacter TaxID=2593542 RepID=UPI00115DC463|nr:MULTISPECIES: ZinT/AdcA family metal-binding protein [unclassified Campylobacter]NDJ27813.1 ZinT/AdcA family metal-binding protein [Campylobacter sp. MIT 19-121]TQR40985.1 hypothetical protein DMB95_05695 [Campylobacter sp. MIT 12-8780]